MRGGRLTLPLFVFLGTSLVSRAQVVSSGTVEIPGTFEFDFDAGVITGSPAADVFWEQFTATTRALQPTNGASIVNLGTSVNFSSLTPAQLQALTYGSSGIDGSNGTSLLVVGDVFAVRTNSGNYAKAVVSKPLDSQQNNGLIIQWATYPRPAPGPTLTSISPNSGVRGATVPVSLTGANFVRGAAVKGANSDVTVSGVSIVS